MVALRAPTGFRCRFRKRAPRVGAPERRVGQRSIRPPALGGGVGGADLGRGARIVGGTIGGYDPKTLSDGRFVAHSGSEFETVPAATADR